MAYSAEARDLRQCHAMTAKGTRCRAWACWGDPRGFCFKHGGRNQVRKTKGGAPGYPPCRCAAYNGIPHRPGSGLCRWPHEDEPKGEFPVRRGHKRHGVQLRGKSGQRLRYLARHMPEKYAECAQFARADQVKTIIPPGSLRRSARKEGDK